MIHSKTTTIAMHKEQSTEDNYKRNLVKDLIDNMPMSEIEKIVVFEKSESTIPNCEKLTATIELIDV